MKSATKYVDGYLIAVPATSKALYLKMAKVGAKMFRDHGALRVVETWSDDVPKGKWTDFYRAVKAKKTERVVFAWIEWPSRAARKTGMKAVMGDPRMAQFKKMPIDGKRMVFGGFSTLLEG